MGMPKILTDSAMTFGGNPLDRASALRADAVWLAQQAAGGLYLPFWQNRPLAADGRIALLPWRSDWEGGVCVFLGLDGTQPLFAIDVAGDEPPALDSWRCGRRRLCCRRATPRSRARPRR